jgi:hypothetical protein
MVEVYEIHQADNDIEDGLKAIIFNYISSTIPKCWTFRFLRWM